jgi:hypothetical protein
MPVAGVRRVNLGSIMKNLMIGTAIVLATAVGALAADLRIPRLASVPLEGFVARSHSVPGQHKVFRPQKSPRRQDR